MLTDHTCESCPDCIHDGNKCCGCYDGSCCRPRQEQTMNEPTLTDTEREALAGILMRLPGINHWYAADLVLDSDWLADFVAARVAEAVDRERAAWATKVEALAGTWEADDEEHLNRFGQHLMGGSVLSCSEHLRALLAADDTEGKP